MAPRAYAQKLPLRHGCLLKKKGMKKKMERVIRRYFAKKKNAHSKKIFEYFWHHHFLDHLRSIFLNGRYIGGA
jgi:hypothetical protein